MVFFLAALWWIKLRSLSKRSGRRDWLWGKLGLVLMGGAMLILEVRIKKKKKEIIISLLYHCLRSTMLLLLSLQSCLTLCDPIDGSPPGSPIPGILQATTLEWVAISFSNA